MVAHGHAMRAAGRQRVVELFSLQTMVRSYQTLYESVLSR
jgi:glycosyltransferase involved in cell wall biosynthesis